MAPIGSMVPGAARYNARTNVTISICRRFLQHVNEKSGGATALATYYRLKWLVCRARAPLDIEDVQPPVVAAQGKSFVHQRPAFEPAMVWELLDDFTRSEF